MILEIIGKLLVHQIDEIRRIGGFHSLPRDHNRRLRCTVILSLRNIAVVEHASEHYIAAQPGTFRSMTDGTVTEEWAWTHHPAWYKDVTGRDPREDYERELRRQQERARAADAREHEQDARERDI